MKIGMLLVFAAAVAIFDVAGAAVDRQTDKIIVDHLMPLRSETGQANSDPNSDGLGPNDSGVTWGLHEPVKDCIVCHESKDASSDKVGLIAPVPGLCYGCHKEHLAPDGWKHGPVARGECLLCHEPHKTKNKSLLNKPIPELCYHCHETETLGLVANHADESYAHCNACHENHASPGRMLLKQDFLKTDAGLAYISKNPSSQPRPTLVDRRGSLGGLEGVEVVPVVDKSDFFKRYGVTEDLVKTVVEQQLQRNGVKILHHKEQAVRQPSLHVELRLMEVPSHRRPGQIDALSGSLTVFLQQKVELLPTLGDGQRRFCTAATWDTGAIVIWGRSQVEEGLKEAIEALVGQFSDDYLGANAKEQALPSIGGEQ